MLTREQLSNAAKQCVLKEEECLGQLLVFEQKTVNEFIEYVTRMKNNSLSLSEEVKEKWSSTYLSQITTLKSWLQIAIQKFQQNAILIDELLIAFDENRLSELSVIPPVPKEYRLWRTYDQLKLETIEKACLDAITAGDSETIDILLSIISILETPLNVNKLFEHTINKGDATILTILSQEPWASQIDPSIERYYSHTDEEDIICKSHAIVFASRMGFVDIVDTLIRHYHVDPSVRNNWAIRLASENGHLAVVDRLLQEPRDPRVDPAADDNYAIRLASENGYLAVVDRLLQDSRVDPSTSGNWPIRFASENGHLAVVDRLLQDQRVDPSADNNKAIKQASEKGHLAVVERLKQDPRVDPSVIKQT